MKKDEIGKIILALPVYLWVILFTLLPFLFLFYMSFSYDPIPIYSKIIDFSNPFFIKINLFFKNYFDFFYQSFYLKALFSSLKIATITTFFTAIIGYIFAYSIVSMPKNWRPVLLTFALLPFFFSFLIRIYAWMALLSTHGLINKILIKLGLISEPIVFLGSLFAVYIGMVYCYLPWMIFAIYSHLEKIDQSLIEASYDLGAKPIYTFIYITFPLSISGILTGCIFVFIPVMGEFVIPELLGSSEILTLGRAIYWEFFNQHNWAMTSTIAVISILLFAIPGIISKKK